MSTSSKEKNLLKGSTSKIVHRNIIPVIILQCTELFKKLSGLSVSYGHQKYSVSGSNGPEINESRANLSYVRLANYPD